MVRTSVLLAVLGLLHSSYATQVPLLHTISPHFHAQSLPLPSSPLPWSSLQILSTTDTHGWLRGHLHSPPPENLYSADIGDLISFKAHLDRIAAEKGVDLLFVDSGDTLDGNGFVDADTTGVKGHAGRELLKKVGWDLTTTGNHELYNRTVALDVYHNFIPSFSGRYLSSNVYIHLNLPSSSSSSSSSSFASPMLSAEAVPFGSRYATFTTKNQKRKITAFGVLFNFDRPDRGIVVQSPKEMVKDKWWNDVLSGKEGKETDVFVLVGHMATRDADWKVVHDSIRSYHPHTPILIFSGHAHVRDCTRYDSRSQVLASGRYLETLGFTSIDLPFSRLSALETTSSPLHISRRYLDTNLATYHYHSHATQSNFSTSLGKTTRKRMYNYASQFNLSFTFGVAPQSYYLNRYPPGHPKSLINLYATKVFSTVLRPPPDRQEKGVQPVFLFNTGAARFDIFKGNFTRDDQLTVIPFENGLWYFGDLELELVEKVDGWLNNLPGEPELDLLQNGFGLDVNTSQANHAIFRDSFAVSSFRKRQAKQFLERSVAVSDVQKEKKLSYGYVTQDDCGPVMGDDTPHRPLPAFDIPDFVLSSRPDAEGGKKKVDLVFYEFIAPLVVKALNALQEEKKYSMDEVKVYSELKANELLGEYARIAWN